MNIYPEEKILESRILSDKATSSLIVSLSITEADTDLFVDSLNKMTQQNCDEKVSTALAKMADNIHPDLMYGEAILASTVMNNNDDVFLPDETWAARYTPVNTPFNDDHVECDIIGHIFAARPIDVDGKVITGEQYPDYFDILVNFVVYKDIFPAIAKEIADKGPKGEKFVSMEAKFKNFDYAIVGPDKETKIIARNADTAFLTKYLRVYGGEGYFRDYKVGRVLRDFRFSGMGNVDRPGNSASEYKKLENYRVAASSELQSLSKVVIHITKGKTMKVETIEQANTVIAELTAKLETLESEKNTSQIETVKAELKTANEEKASLTDKFNGEKTKADLAQQEVEKSNAKIKELETTLETAKAELKVKSDKLDEINLTAKTTARVAELKELGIEVTDVKATEISKLSDEAFASVIEFSKAVATKQISNSDPEAVAKAAEEAKKALEKVKADEVSDPTRTAGEPEPTDIEKIQKTAARLVQSIRTMNKKPTEKVKK